MNQTMQDIQAIQSGQITKDQLPADRQQNVDTAIALAKTVPMEATQAKLDGYNAVKNDINDVSAQVDQGNKTCAAGFCASNFTLAKALGTAVAAGKVGDIAADTIRAIPGLDKTWAGAASREWKAIQDIGDSGTAGGQAGAQAFGQGGLERATPPGSAGGTPSSNEGGGPGSQPPGTSAGGEGSGTSETVANGLKATSNLADAALKTYRLPEDAQNNFAERESNGADRGVSALKGLSDASEAYNNFQNGNRPEGWASGLRAAGNFLKSSGNPQLGEALENGGNALSSANNAYQQGMTMQGASQGLQALGNAVKTVNIGPFRGKDVGAAIQDTGKLVGIVDQIQGIQQTEAQVQQTEAHLTDTINQRITNLQQFQQLQLQLQQQQQLQQQLQGQQIQLQQQQQQIQLQMP